MKLLDDYTEAGDFDEQYLFDFERGVVELLDCDCGDFPTLKRIAVEYALEYGYGQFIDWTVGDEEG